MPFLIVRNDITRMNVDAIVNATNNELIPGGGVCGAIFQAAGSRELIRECRDIGFCRTGEAVLTGGYNLPAEYIIHTPGPIWSGGGKHEAELLAASYRNSLNLAKENEFESIAFPLISSGIYGYPVDKALETASVEIQKFLVENEMTVYLVLYDNESFRIGKKAYPDIHEYISERLIPKTRRYFSEQAFRIGKKEAIHYEEVIEDKISHISLNLMETFQKMLFRKIDESGMKDPEVYKKANIDRKLFSKIRSNPDY
ncbi:MAG: macro domain-containing protein, partial [Clostridia bacterium]|nr:macro domain-containing protein [Clostridia bacterium]